MKWFQSSVLSSRPREFNFGFESVPWHVFNIRQISVESSVGSLLLRPSRPLFSLSLSLQLENIREKWNNLSGRY